MSGDSGKTNPDLLATARATLALAKKHGAADAAATVYRTRDVGTTWRDGKLEKVSDASSRSVGLSLYVDGKYGAMSTSDLRPDALERFVVESVGLVKALAKDPHRKLPDPSLYANRDTSDLELFDKGVEALTTEDRLAKVKAIEEGARGSKKGADRILSVTTSFSDSSSEYARVTSNGFEGSYGWTSVSADAEVSVKDDDGRRPEDYASASVLRLADLPDPVLLGQDATYRASQRLGARKIASGTMPIVVEARAARSLLRHLLGPLGGGALQQKESFLEGKLDKEVASSVLTLTDEPLLKRGLASKPFDSEGMTTRTRPIVEKGILRSFFLDTYYASKLGMKPTIGRPTNLVVAPGKKNLQGLLSQMREGILVTSFLGGNSNSTTGVFSLGISGFRIADGERREPIGEMNLSGKHGDFWKRLVAVGDDPYVYSSLRSPSLMFDRVSIAGK